jgi:hypothetical protein
MLRHEYSLQIGDANGGVYALQHSKVPHRMLSQSWGTSHSYHLGNPESDSQPNWPSENEAATSGNVALPVYKTTALSTRLPCAAEARYL